MAIHRPKPPPESSLGHGFVIDGWSIRPDLNLLARNGKRHRINGKFMAVLRCLAEREGLVSRQELFDTVWPDTVVVEECLTRAVSELRKVFRDHPRRPRIIETIPKKGYRLLVPVQPLERSPSVVPPVAASLRRRALSASAIVLVAALAILAHLLGAADSPGPAAPELVRLTSLPGRESHPALAPAGDRLAFVWDGGNADRLQALFTDAPQGGDPHRLTRQGTRCAFPAWSADADRIAFTRIGLETTDICEIPAEGGVERVLVSGDDQSVPIMPDYSPDGRWLAYCTRSPERGGSHSIHVKDLGTGAVRRLTDPGRPPAADVRPRFSADGRSLAYIQRRSSGTTIAVGSFPPGDKTTLEVGNREIIDMVWDPSEPDALLFTSLDGLWRVPARGGPPRQISAGDGDLTQLTAAGAAGIVACTESNEVRDIWFRDLPVDASPAEAHKLITSSQLDARPTWSSDGRSIAFISNRSGDFQLWAADADGSNLRCLTDLKDTVLRSPAWSPDDRAIAFEAYIAGQSRVCLIDLESSEVSILTPSGPHERAPSWSADGRFLYVSRSREEDWYIVRRPVDRSAAEPLTTGSGFGAIEAPDGSGVFYSRITNGSPELWWVSLASGREERLPVELAGRPVGWTVRPGGIYFSSHRNERDDVFALAFLSFSTGTEVTLFETKSRSAPTFDVSPDERSVIFDRAENSESDIVGLRGL